LELLKQSGKPFIARLPLISGVNADAANLLEVQLLPYNPAAPAKYRSAGRHFPLEFNDEPVPFEEFRNIFTVFGLSCVIL